MSERKLPQSKSQQSIATTRSSSQSSLPPNGHSGSIDNLLNRTEKSLDDIQHSIKVNAFHMRKSLDKSNVAEAITYASLMLNELASNITPKEYYEVYISVCDQLRHFQGYLSEKHLTEVVVKSEDSLPEIASASAGAGAGVEAEGSKDVQANSPLDEQESTEQAAQREQQQQQAQKPSKLDRVTTAKSSKLSEFYQLVQYIPQLLPRLYLMLTVGSVYLKQKYAPKNELLTDMLEMCKGVQNPIRGLFLRYYLQQVTKEEMPDTKESVNESFVFILSNFTEMNKLWVRLQYQGHSKEREKRTQERKELKLLVGFNLVRLSQLESLTKDDYIVKILPKILEQIVVCKDVLAQEYLMEALIQVFPDEYNLSSLQLLLKSVGELHPRVNIKNIIISFIDRFSAGSNEDGSKVQLGLFNVFYDQIVDIVKNRTELSVNDAIQLCTSLTNLILKLNETEKVDEQLEQVVVILKDCISDKIAKDQPLDIELSLIVDYFDTLLNKNNYENILSIFTNQSFFKNLTQLLTSIKAFAVRLKLALLVAGNIISNKVILSDSEYILTLFEVWLLPLVKDTTVAVNSNASDSYKQLPSIPLLEGKDEFDYAEFSARQAVVCKVLMLIDCTEGALHGAVSQLNNQFLTLTRLRNLFKDGGVRRLEYTVPELVIKSVALQKQYVEYLDQIQDGSEEDINQAKGSVSALFKFMHQSISMLSAFNHPQLNVLALKLFLYPLKFPEIFKHDGEMIAYELLVQAFTIYEDCVSDSKLQLTLLQFMIGSLYDCSNSGVFSNENYDTLITKLALYSARQLRKEDQCRLILQSTFLFHGKDSSPSVTNDNTRFYRDHKRVLECLQKCLKIADSSMDSLVSSRLFVDILNLYIQHFQLGNEAVTVKYINGLIDLIFTTLQKLVSEGGAGNEKLTEGKEDAWNLNRVVKYFNSTLVHINELKQKDSARYSEVTVLDGVLRETQKILG